MSATQDSLFQWRLNKFQAPAYRCDLIGTKAESTMQSTWLFFPLLGFHLLATSLHLTVRSIHEMMNSYSTALMPNFLDRNVNVYNSRAS